MRSRPGPEPLGGFCFEENEMTEVVSTATLVAELASFRAGQAALLNMKSVNINGHAYTRADERWISEHIADLESRIVTRQRSTSFAVVINPR